MAGAAFLLALYLRVGDLIDDLYTPAMLAQWTASFVAIAATVFLFMDLYRGVWRYASLNDLLAIAKAATLTMLVFAAVMFVSTRLEDLPRSVPVIAWFILAALLGGPRFLYRLFKDRRLDLTFENSDHPRIPVLLAGAGDEADLFIRSLRQPRESHYRIVGMVAETAGRVGRQIHGVEVLGTLDGLPAVIEGLHRRGDRPQRLVLTDPAIDGRRLRELVEAAGRLGMTLARLPRLTDFKPGSTDKVEPRPVALEDLLGRPQTPLDREAMRVLIEGRRVLITGAGGSIGSELVRQIAGFRPADLALVENSEFALYTIDLEMANRFPALPRRALIADVRDRDRMRAIFAEVKPELVFHAAALKHVPMVEANICEGLFTNAVGTRNVADACREAGTRAMVLISTDKAVNPTNVMGASKRIAEIYCQALDLAGHENDGTRFVTVRFGNVLGSTGSVVPLFQKQLAAGGPLTVTHPEMKRYFMTIREAVELILEASAIGSRGHEQEGKIFVLDMGEPVRIIDLARQMIRLAGFRPEEDIRIEVTGLRPGEKLFEEIFHDSESPVPTPFAGLLLAAPRGVELETIANALGNLERSCRTNDTGAAMAILRGLVPEYAPPD
ncbi:MAG: polysaccharide biosynthesis protein [Magnetospirillum sp. WYHS-4]